LKEEVKIIIKVDNFETTIKGSKDQTILDTALENGVDAPYSCQGGACATCIGRLVSGNAAMQQNHILTDDEIDDGLVLTCQALPLSNSIYIDYDDV
jgi:ring-1,2-phenylacetyl-CoA epoxidase subunit PaaE